MIIRRTKEDHAIKSADYKSKHSFIVTDVSFSPRVPSMLLRTKDYMNPGFRPIPVHTDIQPLIRATPCFVNF